MWVALLISLDPAGLMVVECIQFMSTKDRVESYLQTVGVALLEAVGKQVKQAFCSVSE